MNLEHFAMSGRKEMLINTPKPHKDAGTSKGHRRQLNDLPIAKATQFKQQNKLILDYNPNYKIN